jgi:hypothetical protein
MQKRTPGTIVARTTTSQLLGQDIMRISSMKNPNLPRWNLIT